MYKVCWHLQVDSSLLTTVHCNTVLCPQHHQWTLSLISPTSLQAPLLRTCQFPPMKTVEVPPEVALVSLHEMHLSSLRDRCIILSSLYVSFMSGSNVLLMCSASQNSTTPTLSYQSPFNGIHTFGILYITFLLYRKFMNRFHLHHLQGSTPLLFVFHIVSFVQLFFLWQPN
jgi:hypothetical protein